MQRAHHAPKIPRETWKMHPTCYSYDSAMHDTRRNTRQGTESALRSLRPGSSCLIGWYFPSSTAQLLALLTIACTAEYCAVPQSIRRRVVAGVRAYNIACNIAYNVQRDATGGGQPRACRSLSIAKRSNASNRPIRRPPAVLSASEPTEYRVPWSTLEYHEYPEYPGVPWSTLEYPGAPWSTLEYPGVP